MYETLQADVRELLEACDQWWEAHKDELHGSESSNRYAFLTPLVKAKGMPRARQIWNEMAPYSSRWDTYAGDV